MKKLFELGNQYVQESDWKVIAVLKFCLISMGILIGIRVPEKQKKAVAVSCIVVFFATYIPLMVKLFRMALRKEEV